VATDDPRGELRSAFVTQWGQVVATLIRLTGDWALAEDCAQEAFSAAAAAWPRDGTPRRPGAWLTTAARNHAIDRMRRMNVEARKLKELAALHELESVVDESAADDVGEAIPDDRLRLIFTCCHPALPLEARVALTLRTLCGLTVAEIARAFGVSEHAMNKRLVRTRQKIAHARIPYRVPDAHSLPERRNGVLAVLYLLFTEGYAPSDAPDVLRRALSTEAIRLTRTMNELMPDDGETLALLALELFHDARAAARVGGSGELVSIEEQDRSCWDRTLIAEAAAVLDDALCASTDRGPYLIQACVARLHAAATSSESTSWGEIAALYGELAVVAPSPYAELSRAVALAMSDGVDAGLDVLDDIARSGRLDGNAHLPAARADLLRRAGRLAEAAVAYRSALELVSTDAERRYLERRLRDVRARAG
jgi:RNA polymerase sigma-70 factor (ECF subfamily)